MFVQSSEAQAATRGRTLKVGVYDNNPKIYREHGKIKGFWAEITDYIAKEEGWDIEYVFGTWEDGLKGLEDGDIDLMVDVAVTKARKELYDFNNEAAFISWSGIYTEQHNEKVNNFFDLEGATISVLNGSVNYTGENGIKDILESFDINVHYLEYDTYDEVFAAASTGMADFAIANMVFGGSHKAEYGLRDTPIIFRPSQLSYAMPKGAAINDELIKRIDHQLAKMKAEDNGVYDRAVRKYFWGVDDVDLNLTDDEKEWLKEHPIIRFGVDPEFAPFEFVAANGDYRGIAAENLELIADRVDVTFERQQDLSWNEVVEMAKTHEIDMLTAVGITDDRKEYLNYTVPYLSFPRSIISTDKYGSLTLDDLSSLKVGVQENSSHYGYLIENSDVKPKTFNTFKDALVALSQGEIDAVVGNLAVSTYEIQKLQLTNLKISGYIGENFPLAMAVRKDWPELVGILDKALSSISEYDRIQIMSRWVPVEYSDEILPRLVSLNLTDEEKAWLSEHRDVRLGVDATWPPFEFLNTLGVYSGMGADYVDEINEQLDINMTPVPDLSWIEVMKMMEDHDLDVVPVVSKTPERSKFMLFTNPYTQIPMVLVTKSDVPFIKDISELDGQTVAVIKGYITQEYLERDHPGINLILVSSIKEGLQMIKSGKALGLVDNMTSINYELTNENDNTYKISSILPYTFDLRFGVRNDWPEMVGILNRALDSIPESKRSEIYDRWLSAQIETRMDWVLLLKITGAVFLVAGVVIAGFVYSNRKLDSLVKQRTEKLEKSTKKIKKINEIRTRVLQVIAHQMRTPLSVIKWNLEMLLNPKLKLDKSQKKGLLAGSYYSIEDGIRIISGVLRLLELEENKVRTVKKKVNILKLFHPIEQDYHRKAALKKIKIEGKVVPAKIPLLHVDVKQMEEVFGHLFNNALLYTTNSNDITWEMDFRDDTFVFSITNTGIGIIKNEQSKIFTPFYRGSNAIELAPSGSGISLTLVKRYMKAHQGSIDFSSDKDGKTTFWIELPI